MPKVKKRITPDDIVKMIEMRQQGYRIIDISHEIGASPSNISRYLQTILKYVINENGKKVPLIPGRLVNERVDFVLFNNFNGLRLKK